MKILSSLFLLSTLVLFVGCQQQATTTETETPAVEVETVEADSAGESESESEAPSEFLVDVRSQEEWDSGHLSGATHIPHTQIADRIGEVTEDKSAKLVLYCQAGGRAGRAKEALEQLGYTNVENGGGMEDLKERYTAE